MIKKDYIDIDFLSDILINSLFIIYVNNLKKY